MPSVPGTNDEARLTDLGGAALEAPTVFEARLDDRKRCGGASSTSSALEKSTHVPTLGVLWRQGRRGCSREKKVVQFGEVDTHPCEDRQGRRIDRRHARQTTLGIHSCGWVAHWNDRAGPGITAFGVNSTSRYVSPA